MKQNLEAVTTTNSEQLQQLKSVKVREENLFSQIEDLEKVKIKATEKEKLEKLMQEELNEAKSALQREIDSVKSLNEHLDSLQKSRSDTIEAMKDEF